MKIKYPWQRAEQLLIGSTRYFDAAELTYAAQASGWRIGKPYASKLIHELVSYGLVVKEGNLYRYSVNQRNTQSTHNSKNLSITKRP